MWYVRLRNHDHQKLLFALADRERLIELREGIPGREIMISEHTNGDLKIWEVLAPWVPEEVGAVEVD